MPAPIQSRPATRQRAAVARRAAAAALAIALALHGPGFTWLALARQGPAIAPEQLAGFRSDLDKLQGTLKAVLEDYPTESFDVLALSTALDFNIGAVISWVQSNVAWVPYAGTLRGAGGVLLDRRGNSLDQALLLATLLDHSGVDVRLAHAVLAEDIASSHLPGVVAAGVAALQRAPGSEVSERRAADLARAVGVSLAEVRAREVEARASSQQIIDAVQELAASQATALLSAMPHSRSKVDSRRSAVRALMDHWWVQYRDGTGWQNADPVFAGDDGAAPGWLPEPTKTYRHDLLPEDLVHRVTLRVVAERWRHRAIEEHVALEFSFKPADFVAKPLTISFLPLSFTSGAPSHLSEDDQLRHLAREEKEWLPVLSYGDQTVWTSSIHTDGRVNQRPNLTATTRKFSAAQSALGGLGAPRPSESHLSAVWLDYQFEVPREPDRVVRRQLFDLLGEHRRALNEVPTPEIDPGAVVNRGLALIGETQILPSVSWLQTPYVQHLLFDDLLANIEPAMNLAAALHRDIQGLGDPLVKTFQQLDPLPADLYLFQLYRTEMSRQASRVYLHRPNLVSRHTMAAEQDGRVIFVVSLDIVANDVSVMPAEGVDPFRARLEQGVLDTALEVVAGATGIDPVLARFTGADNAASLLYRSGTLGLDWVAVRTGDERGVSWSAHDPEAAARVRQALAGGVVVYMPIRGVEQGGRPVTSWWEIHPDTGQTLGIGPKGWGRSDTGGYLMVLQAGVKPLLAYASQKTIRATLFCAFAAATAVIVMAVGVTSAAILNPMLGGIFGVLVGLKAGEIIPVVFQACIEVTLFRAP